MAYGTQETLSKTIGEAAMEKLASFPAGTTAPSTPTDIDSVIEQARAGADAEIDAALARCYVVPFAAITDVPPTPPIIQKLSDLLTAADMFLSRFPDGDHYKALVERAEKIIKKIQDKVYAVPGAAEVDGDQGSMGMAFGECVKPLFAGVDDDEVDRMDGW